MPERTASRTIVAVLTLAGLALPAAGQIFRVKEPELVFRAETGELQPGIYLLTTDEEFREIVGALDPAPEPVDLGEAKLLVVVGEDRTDDCRQTVLEEVGTRFRTARVTLKERFPGPTCRCAEQEPVRSVFGVLVATVAAKAKLERIAVEVDCGAAGRRPAGTSAAVEEILSGTLVDGRPGARLVTTDEAWAAVCAELNQADSCPAVDFTRSRVAIAVGQGLENSCRRTVSEGITLDGTMARIGLREIYPAPDRMCAQVVGGFQVYAFRVPASVETVAVDSHTVR